MERKFYKIFRKSTAARLLLLFSLLVGGGNSVWAQKSLPYSYGFENYDLAAEGWTIVDGQSSNGLSTGIMNSPNAHNYNSTDSKYVFRFYGNTTATQYLVSPLLDDSDTGISVLLYWSGLLAYGSGTRTFYVGYSTTTNDVKGENVFTWDAATSGSVSTDKAWYSHTTSFPTGTKYVAIKYAANSHIYFDDISIEAQEQYKAPRNPTIISTTSTSATISWTNGRDETAWEIAYSAKENFNPETEGVKVSVDSNPTTLTGLVEEVTYYAYVRANYSGNYSAWSDSKVIFTPCTEQLTINDGNTTSYYVPIYGWKANYDLKSQVIIPKASLTSLTGQDIKQLTFYASQSSVSWGTAKFDVYLNEVENTTYAQTPVFELWGSKVFSNGSLSISENKMVVEFDTPYTYHGGNLMIGFQTTATGSNVTSAWYGVSGDKNEAYYYYGSSSYTTSSSGHLPKITFKASSPAIPVTLGTNGYTTFACPRPLDLANLPSGLKAYKASVAGTTVTFSEVNQVVPANTGILLVGEAGQTYDIPFAESGTAPEGNAFEVNSTGGTFSGDGDYTYFGLIKDSNPLTFGEFDPSSVAIPTNKAYLKVLTSSLPAGARQLTFLFDEDETTAIKDLPTAAAKKADDAVFSITGQRVSTPTKGLYIINGKKYIIK